MKSLLAVAVVAVAIPAWAQAPGTFTPTGLMQHGRDFHAAVLLTNGKVLVVGDWSADLYDPATGTFTSAGQLNVMRGIPSATLLSDGKVLIAGGDPGAPSTAEIYDPSAGTFTRTGDLHGRHIVSTATLLPNGKVLIAGGYTDGCCPTGVAKAELYDPATGTFSLAAPYAGPGDGLYVTDGPSILNAVLLLDGRVLLPGEPQSEIYDPDTNTFALTGVMATPCVFGGVPTYISGRTSTLLRDGRVLLTGGEHEDCGRFGDAELYDPATGVFSHIGVMQRVRDNHQATLLRDGTVLITGGESQGYDAASGWWFATITTAEIYDPQTGLFTLTGDMTQSRAGQTATLLANGEVLITGGYTYFGIGQSSCCSAGAELYMPDVTPVSGRRRIAR